MEYKRPQNSTLPLANRKVHWHHGRAVSTQALKRLSGSQPWWGHHCYWAESSAIIDRSDLIFTSRTVQSFIHST